MDLHLNFFLPARVTRKCQQFSRLLAPVVPTRRGNLVFARSRPASKPQNSPISSRNSPDLVAGVGGRSFVCCNFLPEISYQRENGSTAGPSRQVIGGVYGLCGFQFHVRTRNGTAGRRGRGLSTGIALYSVWSLSGRSASPGSHQERLASQASGQGLSGFTRAHRKAR